MAVWAMLIGMATLINITMIGAMTSLAGNIPDSSFLAILSRYLVRKGEPPGVILSPLEAASRLERLRRRALQAAAAVALLGAGTTIWALAAGWGAVAMTSITLWLLAANLAFLEIPLALWRRRAGKINDDAVEEAVRKSQSPPDDVGQEKDAGTSGG